MVVLRSFPSDAIAHPKGSVDPLRDLKHIEEEFILQDQMVVERRLERLRKDIQKRRDPELERERDLLVRCLAVLESATPAEDDDEEILAREKRQAKTLTLMQIETDLAMVGMEAL